MITIDIPLRTIFEGRIKKPPDTVKYIFITDNTAYIEHLARDNYIPVYISAVPEKNAFTLQEFTDCICNVTAIHAKDYYYLPVCSFLLNKALQEVLLANHFKCSTDSWKILSNKDKNADYYLQHTDELKQNIDDFIRRCEGVQPEQTQKDFNHLNHLNHSSNKNENNNEWEPPVPFNSITVPPFPIDCLPSSLKYYAIAISEDKQVPIDMPAVEILAVMAVCVQGKFKILVKPGWIEPLNLYSLMIAASGERKSAALRAVIKYINQYEIEYNEAHQDEIAQSQKEKEMLRKELEDLTNRATKKTSKSTPATKEEVFAKQKELNDFVEKKKLRLLADDATPEALTSLLAGNDGLISVISAEGGIFDTLNGRYSSSPNIDTFLKAYSGDFIRVDRKGRESEDIPNPCATILLTVQPDVLDGLMGNTTFRGRGLTARFLYSMPTTIIGDRRYKTKEIPDDLKQVYKDLCYDLLDLVKPETPTLIKLSEEAAQLSEKFFYDLEARLIDDLEPIRDFAAKLHGNIARIAGILHTVDNYKFIFEENAPVSGETFQKAIDIGYYFLDHAIAAFQQMNADACMQSAKYILKRLEKHKPDKVTRSELARLCKKFRSTEELNEPLSILVERGYLKEEQLLYSGTGRPPEPVYHLNPLFFK